MNPLKALVALLATGTLLLSGCGSTATLTAAEQVPSLRSTLSQVDSALAGHHYFKARQMLGDLISETERAERDGSLSAGAADRIISSARKLLALVPRPTPTVTTPTPQPEKQPSKEPKKHKPKPHERDQDKASSAPSPTVEVTPTPTPTSSPTATATTSPAALTSPTP